MISKVRFAEYLSLVLRSLDVDCIYTLPGDLTLELLSSLEMYGTKILCFPDEESVITAADFHAHLSGLSVVVCSDGYSLTKMVNPLIACRLRYSPVAIFAVSHSVENSNTSELNRHPQPTRVQCICNSIGIDSYRISECLSTHELVDVLSRPIITHQPSVIEISPHIISCSNWLNHGTLSDSKRPAPKINDGFDQSHLTKFNTDRKGLFIIGNALNRYRSQYTRLLLKKQFSLDYLIMPSIKGLINEDDSRCLGTYLGDFSSDHISKALTNAEQVILIGVEDFEMAWTSFKPFSGKSGWSLKTELMERGKKVLTVDCDKYSEGDETVFHGFSLVETFFEGANFILHEHSRSMLIDSIGSSHYDTVTYALSALRNSVFIVDVGISTLCLFNIRLSPCSTFISNTVWANMGSGFAAGLAISNCLPDHKIWIIVGDGSAIMSMHDLAVFTRYDIDVRIIVLDNKGYLTERIKHAGSYNNGFQIDWLMCAQSMGFGTCLKCDRKEDITTCLLYTSPSPRDS